ncbi:MAG: LuxR C-terminal-related transcriptional regulator [Rhodobacteraceae bacterium]|nr:LuxR C-terminal-related transcriptional regulator [Paracoccaceae bacterium]MCY4137435.1 LuxR C-terminal-related transcriptional regulator [Paracoccaceae bacterium]
MALEDHHGMPGRERVISQEFVFASLGTMTCSLGSQDFFDELRRLSIRIFDPQSIVTLVFAKGQLPRTIDHWIPDAKLRRLFEETYTDFGYLLDPFHDLAMSGFEDGAYRLRDVAPDQFFRSRASRRYYRQTTLVDEVGCLHRMRDGRVAHLSLGRHRGRPVFGKRALARLKSLSPALMALIAAHVERAARYPAQVQAETPPPTLREEIRRLSPVGGRPVTARESEVASLIVQGHSTVSIGLNLGISPQTVKVHRRNIYRKLGVSSLAELYSRIPASRAGTSVQATPLPDRHN